MNDKKPQGVWASGVFEQLRPISFKKRAPSRNDADEWGQVAYFDEMRNLWRLGRWNDDLTDDEFYASHWMSTGFVRPIG